MTESSGRQATAVPPISALFLVVFDQKIGYSIAHKRAIPGLQLDGVVEYKSLPSGLHNVKDDLVYFVHEQYAGVSAFVSQAAGEAQRGASFASVGVLVSSKHGRLGRSWLHAASLRELAGRTVKNIEDTAALDEYWETHRVDDSEDHGPTSPIDEGTSEQATGRRKARALSDAAALGHDPHTLSNDHPAISLRKHLDLFGPLLFPLYRAALLRKRILVLTHPPVREACDLVYNLSVISNIPSQLAHILPESEALSPIRPLFNVGVHDITYLSEVSKRTTRRSYLACSTDEILATKKNLYDVLVELPQQSVIETKGKQWPSLRTTEGEQIKATQRDMRRYRALRKELQRIEHSTQGQYHDVDDEDEEDGNQDDESETAPLTHLTRQSWDEQDEYSVEGETSVVEPTSWTAMAYTGFFWWASAGEKDAWLEDERSRDSSLLSDLPLPEVSSPSRPASMKGGKGNALPDHGDDTGESDGSKAEAQALAMILIAFVHRLTRLTLESLAELVESADDESENDDGGQGAVGIESEDLRRMGLDVWSETDKEFARELLQLYFGREAEVRGQGVECCGIKIC